MFIRLTMFKPDSDEADTPVTVNTSQISHIAIDPAYRTKLTMSCGVSFCVVVTFEDLERLLMAHVPADSELSP